MAGLPFRPDVGGPPSRLPIFVPGRVFGRRASPESVPEAPYGRVSDREGPSRVRVAGKGPPDTGRILCAAIYPVPEATLKTSRSKRPRVRPSRPARARTFAAYLH